MPYSRTGKLRRDTAGQNDFSIYDFSGGLNVKGAPQELADNELTQALNGYLRPDGGFESRRGMTLYKSLAQPAPVIGLYRFSQFVKAGNEITSTQTLAQCNDQLFDLDQGKILGSLGTGSKPWSIVTASDPQANPYPDTAAPGLTDVAVICDGVKGPYIYDGSQIYTPKGWKNAHGARWCALINGVVWFGGLKKFPNQVMSTGQGFITGDSFEAIAGYSVFDFGQPVQGFGVIGSGAQAQLVVALPYGFSLVYGTGPANYSQQDVRMDNDGLIAGYTILTQNSVLYGIGNNNAYSFNPFSQTQPTAFSLKVQPWFQRDAFTPGYPMVGDRSSYFAWMYNDRYQVVYSSEVAGVNDTVLIYDTNLGGWTVLQLGVPIYSATLINAPGDPSPWASLVGGNSGHVYTWDPYTATQDSLWDACAWNVAIWDDSTDNTDLGSNVTTWVATKFFKLGEPGSVKSLHRIYPEIQYPVFFAGTATVQTDYQLEQTFTENVTASQTNLATWDFSLWDNTLWSVFPAPRASWNAPASRIDVTNQLPGNPYDYLIWNVGLWSRAPWASVPLPTVNSPGIQAEAFSMGIQTGIGNLGAIWDQATWDAASWGYTSQLPWIFSGITGSFSQLGKR
jgi:hypothetical protein